MIIRALELKICALLLDKSLILPESGGADYAPVSTARGNL